jgi:pimeloyl-ACP methyl ester carboxylesterase
MCFSIGKLKRSLDIQSLDMEGIMRRTNMLSNPKIAALYSDVPPDGLEKFKTFLEAFPYQLLSIDGLDWAYIASKKDRAESLQRDDMLILSGALCAPEVSWQTISAFAEKYRVIAPEYPPVNSMDTLVDGIAHILRQEGVNRAHVLGGSYGGFVAQVFVRRHPELTRSLVLSHTLPPFPEGGERIKKSLRLLSILPEGALRWLMGKRLGGLLPEKTPDTAALHAIYQEMLSFRLTKADLLNLMWRTVDFTNREFTPQDLQDWHGKTLLVLADDDPSTPEDVRARLQALYPNAQMKLFHGSGHATSLTKQEEYLAVIHEFLEGQ